MSFARCWVFRLFLTSKVRLHCDWLGAAERAIKTTAFS